MAAVEGGASALIVVPFLVGWAAGHLLDAALGSLWDQGLPATNPKGWIPVTPGNKL
jgi:hypothetical protein